MGTISQEADKEIGIFLSNWWISVHKQLASTTGSAVLVGDEAPVDLLLSSEIGRRLARIAEAAESQRTWSQEIAQSILADCEAFEAWLNSAPFAHRTPEEFWNTPIGTMILRARLWAGQDRLMSV
jgi:hypothetical protein